MTQQLPSIAFLFPGQGSQAAGMGKELAATYPVARQVFEEADEALGYKLSELCFEGPDDQLRLTEITQPAILTMSVAAFRVLESSGILPGFVAGHSLGEYSAHVAAGTIEFADAVRAVRNRGKYMQQAVPVGEGAMAAILALSIESIEAACKQASEGLVCQPANVNSPDQIVISGAKPAVERAAELCKQQGAKRAIMLPVSAPFHCAMMQPAQDRLSQDLHALNFHPAKIPSDVQRGRKAGDHGGSKPRCLGTPGYRHGAMGALDPQSGRSRRRALYRNRTGKGAHGADAAD